MSRSAIQNLAAGLLDWRLFQFLFARLVPKLAKIRH